MDNGRYIVQVFVGSLSSLYEALTIEASKQTTAGEIVSCIAERLKLQQPENYELAEVIGNAGGQECKERRLGGYENPVAVQMLWPKFMPLTPTNGPSSSESFQAPQYRFCLREKFSDFSTQNHSWPEGADTQLIRDYFLRFLYQPRDKEYPDLCQLPDLNEQTLLDNLKARFQSGHIYTYVGSILIAVNPFKFYPIYNPKYVKLYQNRRLGELPPHIFAIADAAYHTMLRERHNQCIVISGESGSGKTESTNLLLHHLTALSQKGTHGSGVEQTILSAGPVLEAFGNAKTSHNNNSSRFGKFIQVNYKENGMVHGAAVQKYLLEKSRIVSQAKNERNYHVFYYLLAGASEEERASMNLGQPQDYHYLNQSECFTLDGVDESYEFSRLKQSMEMVGFSAEKQKRLFCVLSALLHLGNVEFVKKSTYHHDEAVWVKNPELVASISQLLKVKEETLISALTSKRAKASGETLVINYRLPEAIAARDALAKCLYGALFDWIVLQVNHALLAKKEISKENMGNSIGVLDIFGFEDFGQSNSFEQFCINFANEHLQFYFNQHVFKYEQEEYKREGIRWKNIEFIDNTGCLYLIEGKPHGLLCILDDHCNFPGATNETLLQRFHSEHRENDFYNVPQKRESAFIIQHYAGKVKYQIKDFREKNLDLMRPDIVSVLKNSSMAFVRELIGADPVAVFRWAILRAFFRSYFAFIAAGQRYRGSDRGLKKAVALRNRKHTENMMSTILGVASVNMTIHRILKNKSFRPRTKSTKSLKNLQSIKTLACRAQNFHGTSIGRATRKQPLTVTAQFQISLCQLMETLSLASPFFVRCIKSNSDKIANHFDEEIILRQLRYTGMLETVRIRQSGYNVRLTFEEFIQHYRILLHKGLLSSQLDVQEFLLTMNLDDENYQIGKTKIFLRESEKLKLDYRLHQAILARIVTIQRWYRAVSERRLFLRFRHGIIQLQAHIRRYLAQKMLAAMQLRHNAAVTIQKCWRGYIVRKHYKQLRRGIIYIQSCIRGNRVRERMHLMMQARQRQRKELELLEIQSLNDEPFLSKENSLEDVGSLDKSPEERVTHLNHKDFERNSEIQDDAVIENYLKQHRSSSSSSTTEAQQYHQEQIISDITCLITPPVSPISIASSLLETDNRTEKTKEMIEDACEEKKLKPKKISLKRSKSAKASISDEIIPSAKTHKQIKNLKIRSSSDLDANSSVNFELDRDAREINRTEDDMKLNEQNQKGAFQKAKKHIKSFMILAKKNRNSHEDSEDSGQEDNTTNNTTYYSQPSATESTFKSSDNSIALSSSQQTEYQPSFDQTSDQEKQSNTTNEHRFKTTNKFSRGELCALCHKSLSTLFAQGQRCSDCNQAFHVKCSRESNKRACQMSSSRSPTNRKRNRRSTITRIDVPPQTSWNVTRMSEFTDRNDHIISDVEELQRMDAFIVKKLSQINEDGGKRDTFVDVVFKKALKEFKSNLISTYSVLCQDGEVSLKYKDLIENFEQIMEKVCKQENTSAAFPVTMGVNAFRGFLNEFVSQQRTEEKVAKVKSKKEKRRKERIVACRKGHSFTSVVFNIPTLCEICSSFMWLMEKGFVCQNCKVTCHKKCCSKVSSACREDQDTSFIRDGKIFGARLSTLLIDDAKLPPVIERLITTIEMRGLYTEGLYRKSGAASKVKMLRMAIENDPENVNFDVYAIHVLTSTLKSFFREMPEPLMTFESYDEFVRASDVSDSQERISAIYSIINKLPKANFDLLERLFFHLARVAQQEEYNRMSPSALAIVYAPCILRTNKNVTAQDSLNDVNKQTLCVEYIVNEQLRKVKTTLADIDTLDSACQTATNRLSSLRSSKVNLPKMYLPTDSTEELTTPEVPDEEEILTQHIATLQNEKAILTTTLPTLVRTSSDDEMLSTDVESIVESIDDVHPSQYEEYALTFDLPVTPPSLNHLTKHRVDPPRNRRPPSSFSLMGLRGLNFGEKRRSTTNNEVISRHPHVTIEYQDNAIMV